MNHSNEPEIEQMGADEHTEHAVRDEAASYESPESTQSANKLVLTVALSALAAVIIVVFAVMPAEYGVDPTGVGKMLGLTSLKADQPRKGHGELPSQPSASGALASAVVPGQSNEGSVTLQPGESIEVKADMIGGQGFSYRWSTTAAQSRSTCTEWMRATRRPRTRPAIRVSSSLPRMACLVGTGSTGGRLLLW